MKNLVLLSVFISLMKTGFAEDGLFLSAEPYTIISDLKDATIAPGHFVVQGIAKIADNGLPLKDVQVGMLQNGTQVKTDSLGQFSLVCTKATDSTLYFYKDGWEELLIGNYTFKDQHRITFSVNLNRDDVNTVKRKPVIYCYSDYELTATVKLDPKGVFTFTYPQYNEGWLVKVNPNGGVTDLTTGKNYPYLFWEAKSEKIFYQTDAKTIPGFVINTDSTIQFLEAKLTALGLNQTEQTDFITFWGPVLQKQPYALIQFLVDDAYETEIAELEISPKPDAIRRVYILCSPLNDMNVGMPVVAQDLKSFERFGFTVVEWGGSEIDLTNLKPQ